MTRTRTLLLTLPLALALGLFTGSAATAEPTTGTQAPQLVIDSDFPDPDVIEVDGTYHAYSTSSPGKGQVPHATAPDVRGPWTVQSDVFVGKETWPDWIRTTHGFWAPDVSERPDGTFLMYFTARNDDNGRMCLGAATADDPAGPFVPQDDPLVCNPEEGGNIDASSFVDTDGTHYLLYKNDGNAIGQPSILWLQRTDAAGTTLLGERRELLRNDQPADQGVIEAPVLVKRPSHYVLFFSAGVYTGGGYYTGYATAPSLDGPWTRAPEPLMTTDSLGGAVDGPGGQDVLDDTIVFHGHLPAGGRGMYTADLGWDADHPVVRGSTVRVEAEDATLHGVQPVDDATASGGAAVTGLDAEGDRVSVRVFAPADGGYTLRLGYAADGAVAQGLAVDDGPARAVGLPARDAGGWQELAVDLELSVGAHTLHLEHVRGSARLDSVDLA
ncbi:glycoside hydrolase [Desertihabitans brevis]|uniref:Glycoside hydrolase n=1 Tax=Desertihabitans brevis TaxID=2268447 RepID=A0A367YTA4_9ACTN|nr:family 43 glycosylhydrolase [Desertihabitans brevis]RCK68769.1 glycoside hydrolase [Desertihabitans brevis]